MKKALGGWRSNLESRAMWKKEISLGGLGELKKMWNVLGRLSYDLLNKCSVT
jgi:hypothetical protein